VPAQTLPIQRIAPSSPRDKIYSSINSSILFKQLNFYPSIEFKHFIQAFKYFQAFNSSIQYTCIGGHAQMYICSNPSILTKLR
jgi:hypothetical protein